MVVTGYGEKTSQKEMDSIDPSTIKSFTVKKASTQGKRLIYVDGKEIDQKKMDAIDPNTIESINVLKGENALKKHGEKAKYGTIEITLKDDSKK